MGNISLICDKSVKNSKCVIFQEKLLKILKCYNFLCVQRRHNCSPVARFANCVIKVNLQTFLSIPITQKCQILSCDTLVVNELYALLESFHSPYYNPQTYGERGPDPCRINRVVFVSPSYGRRSVGQENNLVLKCRAAGEQPCT
jgi:hypothetical protein